MPALSTLPDPRTRPVLSIPEAGSYLGLSRSASYSAAAGGFLPTIRINEHRFVVPTASLLRLLDQQDKVEQ